MNTLALLLALGFPALGASHAQAEPVKPSLVCQVQHAIRWRDPAWTEQQCQARAREFMASGQRWGFAPVQLLAMAIDESDLRPEAMREDRGALDVGLMAVRCHLRRTIIPMATSDGKQPNDARNIPKNIPSPTCTNKPVRGLTPAQLMRPSVNIDMGARILATLHRGSLAGYNGGPNAREHGYPEKVAAIMAALGGVEVRVSGKRMRKLVRQIVIATTKKGEK
jgi:hypothetical protein